MVDGRGLNRKDSCIRGHDLTLPENRVSGGGCKLCSRLRARKWRATPEGKAAKRKYAQMYDNTEHGKKLKAARDKRFRESPRGKETEKRNWTRKNNKPEIRYYKMKWYLKKKIQTKPQRIAELEAELERILNG
jgi:hypothetical protein